MKIKLEEDFFIILFVIGIMILFLACLSKPEDKPKYNQLEDTKKSTELIEEKIVEEKTIAEIKIELEKLKKTFTIEDLQVIAISGAEGAVIFSNGDIQAIKEIPIDLLFVIVGIFVDNLENFDELVISDEEDKIIYNVGEKYISSSVSNEQREEVIDLILDLLNSEQ